jgi:hypothetical protein
MSDGVIGLGKTVPGYSVPTHETPTWGHYNQVRFFHSSPSCFRSSRNSERPRNGVRSGIFSFLQTAKLDNSPKIKYSRPRTGGQGRS